MTTDHRTLCIVHHEPGDVGLVAQHLAAHGTLPIVCQPNAGGVLPDPAGVERAIIFGGAMSATDDHDPAIKSELDWIEQALRAGTPLVGICLGAQMIARVLGATIQPHEDRKWEIGYRQLVPTEEGGRLFDGCATFFQWHQEGFSLPRDTVRLATGDDFPEQAYRWGSNVFGFQFHPEVARDQLFGWHAQFGDDMQHPGADPIPKQQDDNALYREGIEDWLERFLSNWIAQTGLEELESRSCSVNTGRTEPNR